LALHKRHLDWIKKESFRENNKIKSYALPEEQTEKMKQSNEMLKVLALTFKEICRDNLL
jgi:hypothetical protein